MSAPSLNLGYDSESMIGTGMKAKTGRYERAVERARKRTIDEVEQEEGPVDLIPKSDADIPATDESISVSTQTDMSMEDFQIQLEVMREENKILSENAKQLKKEVEESLLNEASFKENDEKVLCCTGLSTWELLEKLYIYVKPYLKQHSSLPISTSTCNTNEIKLKSFRARSWVSI